MLENYFQSEQELNVKGGVVHMSFERLESGDGLDVVGQGVEGVGEERDEATRPDEGVVVFCTG